jgi:N-acetylneuraminate synthase
VIAEAGSNHNGDLETALRLIDVAVTAGANAVKFQLFRASKLYPRSAGESDYLQVQQSIYDIIQGMELPLEWLPKLAGHCQATGIAFLVSPFDEEAADAIDPYVPAFKIASYEMTHAPLLQHIAAKGKPIIMSTGTANLEEVQEAVATIRAAGNEQIVLMQCTASYPAPLSAMNLRAIPTLRDATGCPTGLSDHSREPLPAALGAVALGAVALEKHYTLSNQLPGPDHAFAVEPNELAQMIAKVREVESALGHGRKEPLLEELELRAFARRTIFTTRDLGAGAVLDRSNTAVLRSGKRPHGLAPSAYAALLGRRLVRALPAESVVAWEDLAG